MKKFSIIAFAACVALAACTKNEVKPVAVDQEITFETAVYKASSKALIATNKYPKSATFGTVAYRESNKEKYFGPEEVSYNNDKKYWSTATAYYWPKNDALTFMSYSPYKYQESDHSSTAITVTDSYNRLAISDYDVAAHQETDLMVADIQKGQKANTTQGGGTWQKGVPTVFHHKLSQIVAINFQTVDTQAPNDKKDYANGHDGSATNPYQAGDQQFFLNEVSLKNTCFKGNYSYVYDDSSNPATTTEGWTKDDSSTESSTLWFTEPSAYRNAAGKFIKGGINPQRTDASGATATNKYILILPQTFEAYANKVDAPHIYIKYTVRTYYAADGYSDEVIEERVPIYDIHPTWAMNKKITYNFNLTKQRIYWDPQVVNWDSESHTVEI
ncbi:MAG: fimbrillin family protein [Bacteroides sp.]|nr:fimbrillin family protein [Bacteroides sp.]